MLKHTELILTPEEAYGEGTLLAAIQRKLQVSSELQIRPLRRSIDARKRKVVVRVLVELIPRHEARENIPVAELYRCVHNSRSVIIVGAGPAGLFAALRLIELGVKPVVLERGKDVQSRRRDIAAINKAHIVNPESNYCFGEGGAGTYSDGKLYTRSKKRGDVNRILQMLVAHGAHQDILLDAHPHIGTNKLPGVVAQIRERILSAGGEIHFNTKVTDFIVDGDRLMGVATQAGDRMKAEAVLLATGHSARDVYQLLYEKEILIEPKPFALGVRVEHAQSLIDQIQYHCAARDPFLPASSYALVDQVQVNGIPHGVFSFCMCPGGFIVPAATAPGEIVVNGMSPSRRDSRFANSGIVMTVDTHAFKAFREHGPLAGMYFQAALEQKAFQEGGKTQSAPAQRLVDFVEGRFSNQLLKTSYQPGLTTTRLDELLPAFLSQGLKQGFKGFGKKMKGYFTNEAQVIGVESRTSSPVRIPRDNIRLEHPHLKRLFPCGEGAGYAGGIVSAAMDGMRCAEAITKLYL